MTQIEGGSETNGCLQAFCRIPFARGRYASTASGVGTVVNSMGVMTPPSSVAGVRNLCGFAYKDYGTNAHIKIHIGHTCMYVVRGLIPPYIRHVLQ
jgi:hypothetical protein